jgi:TRAP-type transport system small permease protein
MIQLIEAIEWLLVRLGVATGLTTLLITVVIVIDVAGRAIFSAPLHSGTEISELLLVTLVFLGLAAAQQNRQNYAIDVFSRHLPIPVQRLLEMLGYMFCIAVVGLLAWLSTKQAFNSYERGEAGFGIISFPIWPARFILAIGLWLLALQFVCDIIRQAMGKARVVLSEAELLGADTK